MSQPAFNRTPEFYTAQAELRALAVHTQSTAIRYIDYGKIRLELTVDPYGAYTLTEVPRIGDGEPPVRLVDKGTAQPQPTPEAERPAQPHPSLWDRLLGR